MRGSSLDGYGVTEIRCVDSAEKQRRQNKLSFYHVIDLSDDSAHSSRNRKPLLKKKTVDSRLIVKCSLPHLITFHSSANFFVDSNDMKCVEVTFEFFVGTVVTVFINSYLHTLDFAKGCLALP